MTGLEHAATDSIYSREAMSQASGRRSRHGAAWQAAAWERCSIAHLCHIAVTHPASSTTSQRIAMNETEVHTASQAAREQFGEQKPTPAAVAGAGEPSKGRPGRVHCCPPPPLPAAAAAARFSYRAAPRLQLDPQFASHFLPTQARRKRGARAPRSASPCTRARVSPCGALLGARIRSFSAGSPLAPASFHMPTCPHACCRGSGRRGRAACPG